MNLQTETQKAINNGIDSFLFYVKELGIEKAKKITSEETILKEVINFINNYTVRKSKEEV